MGMRKIESESEARRCLASVASSGMSLKEWARAHGIDGRSLHAWKMNLERGSGMPTSARTASMQLVELVPAPSSSSSRYVLHVGPVSVEFGDDFEPDTLRRVIEVLRSC